MQTDENSVKADFVQAINAEQPRIMARALAETIVEGKNEAPFPWGSQFRRRGD